MRYLARVALGGLPLAGFSYISLMRLGEIPEMAARFNFYPVLYVAFFLLGYLSLSLGYFWLFFKATGLDLQRAFRVDGSAHLTGALLLPYLLAYETVYQFLGFSLFYVFLVTFLGLRFYALLRETRKHINSLSLLGIVILGLLLRLLLLLTSQGVVGSEEAIMGLMARHMLFDRESYVFLWGQPYMGSLEATLAAPVFFLFGASSLTLKMVPFVFSLLFIVASYFLVKLMLGEEAALVSALLVSVSPVFLTVFSMLANAYIESLFFGATVLALTCLLTRRERGLVNYCSSEPEPVPSLSVILRQSRRISVRTTGVKGELSLRTGSGESRTMSNLSFSTGSKTKIWSFFNTLARGDKRLYLFLFLGFVSGLAFWNNLTSAIYLSAAFLFLGLKWRRWTSNFMPKILLLVAGFVFGSLPLWLFNLKHQWVTFGFLTGGMSGPISASEWLRQILANIGNLFGVARVIVGGGQAALTDYVIYVLYGVSVIYAFYLFSKTKGGAEVERQGMGVLLLLVALLAAFFSISRYGSLNEARYALGLYLALPAFLALLLSDLGKKSRTLQTVLLVAVLAFNLTGNLRDVAKPPPKPSFLASYLISRDTRFVYTDFWTAYQLTFVSKEKILSYVISGPNVYPPYMENVTGAPLARKAVVLGPDEEVGHFESKLKKASIGFQKANVAGKTVFHSFSKNVEPFLGIAKF